MNFNLKKILFFILISIIFVLGLFYLSKKYFSVNSNLNNPLVYEIKNIITEEKDKGETKNVGYLAQYNFENLKNRKYLASEITKIGKLTVIDEARKELIKKGEVAEDDFNFESSVIIFSSNGKRISGMMNVPMGPKSNKMPAIIMIRGYADNQGYFVGSGSWRAADELARKGFVTVSLDFLGFGLSEMESKDILEARFEKPISVLDLIESVKKLEMVDSEKIGIWAHSNGGQIAISVLEISGGNYPTVLWAPMTNPFPQSVLETIDETSESGLEVKNKIENFEKEYESKLYSIDNFYSWIKAPILIHQGTEDPWCKVEWQENIKNNLNLLGKEVYLEIEEGNDHNFKQSWKEIMTKDILFFKDKFNL